MSDGGNGDRFSGLGMLASALAGRPVAVAAAEMGAPPWTDGETVFFDPSVPARRQLESVAVQASLIAAGSLAPAVIGAMVRRPRLAKRYLAVEGHRALLANDALLPGMLGALADHAIASRSDSATSSLATASGKVALDDPPEVFGVIRPKKVLAASSRAVHQVDHETAGHVPRRPDSKRALAELDDGEVDDADEPDLFTSPVGGGGAIGKWLKKMLSSVRKTGSGGGPPGADSPTITSTGPRAAQTRCRRWLPLRPRMDSTEPTSKPMASPIPSGTSIARVTGRTGARCGRLRRG